MRSDQRRIQWDRFERQKRGAAETEATLRRLNEEAQQRWREADIQRRVEAIKGGYVEPSRRVMPFLRDPDPFLGGSIGAMPFAPDPSYTRLGNERLRSASYMGGATLVHSGYTRPSRSRWVQEGGALKFIEEEEQW